MRFSTLLVQNFFWRGLALGSSFLLNILISRTLGSSSSGQLFYLVSILALIIQVSGFSMESGILYFSARRKIDEKKLSLVCTAWTLLVGLLLLAAFSLTGLTNNELFGSIPPVYLVLFCCGTLLSTYFSALSYARLDFMTPNMLSILNSIGLLWVLTMNDGQGFTEWYLLSFGIQGSLIMLFFYLKKGRRQTGALEGGNELKAFIKYVATCYLLNVLFFIMHRVDYYFLYRFSNPSELGNYIQVSKIAQVLFTLCAMTATVVAPVTARQDMLYLKEKVMILSRSLFSVLIACCLFLLLTGNFLFPFIFGKDFSLMYRPFLLLTPGILFLGSLFPVNAYYSGQNRLGINVRATLLALTVIVIGDWLLIPRFGSPGAAIVSSVGYICYQGYIFSVFKKETGATYSNLLMIQRSDIRWLLKYLSQAFRTA